MRGDLENRIHRRVADRLAGSDMLLAEIFDHRRSGRMAVGEDAGHAAFADHRPRQVVRE